MKLTRLKENLNWILGAVFLFIVLGVGGYWLYRNDFKIDFWKQTPLEVQGANFDFGARKIPKDAKQIEFIFSKSLDPETVSEDSFQIQPDIDGYIGINENKLIYHLEESLEKGNFYDVYIDESIQSKDGTSLGKTLSYSLEVGGDAKVVRFNPEGSVENLNQSVLVFFNMPMVDMSSLNQRDKLECPLKANPSIDGDCQWINSSVLEYQTDRLYGATDYDISIDDSSLNYSLTGQTEYEINTPDLKVYLPSDSSISPAGGVSIRTNFPVSLDELYDKLNVYYDTINGDSLDYTLKTDKDRPNTYIVELTGNFETPQKNKFSYDEYYHFEIKKGLKPKNGNRPMSHGESVRFRTKSLINQTVAYRKIYSGDLQVDTKKFSKPSSNQDWVLPVKDLYLQVEFDQDIPNENNLENYFSIDGLDLDVEYGKKKQNDQTVQDLKTIKITPSRDSIELKSGQVYSLKVDSDISDYLYEDETIQFKTASENTLNGIEYVDHTKTCLYFSNKIDLKPEDVYVSPEAEIVNVSSNEYVPRDIRRQAESKPNYEQQNQYLKDQGYCPNPSSSQNKWVVQTRLNPNRVYSIGAKKGLEDIYGHTLTQNNYQDIETGQIDKENKMIFSFSHNDESVLPSYKPLILNIQSRHMDSMNLEVCEMDWEGYQHYLNNARSWNPTDYKPNCVSQTTKSIDMQNKGWAMADNIIDIQKDILGRDFETNFILTRARLDGFEYGREYGKSFTDLYVRSNAFISAQKAENKSLLFVTDYEGNRLQEPLDLNFYRKFNGEYSPVDVNLQTIQTGYVYETQNDFDIAKIQSDKYFGILNTDMDDLSNRDYDYFGGETTNQADYLYIHTDRPIYKPGDTVQFKGYYRQFGLEGYQPVKTDSDLETDGMLSVLDSDENTVREIDINLDENSNFTGSFHLPDSGSLGFHMFEFDPVGREKSGNWNRSIAGDSNFRVEEYEPESMEVNIETSKDKYMLGQKAKISISPKYYFGGKVKNTKGEIRLLTQNYFFDADDYRDYQFGEGRSYFNCLYWGACDNSDNFKESIDFQIDESGEHTLDYEFDDEGEKLYSFEVYIQDPDTQKWISNSKSIALHSTDGYVGLDHNYYNSQEQVDIDGVVLDTQGKPKPDSQVELKLIKKDYNNAKYQGVDGVFYNDYTVQETTEQTELVETDRNGKFEKAFEPKDTGQYKLKATYTGNNDASFTSTVSLYVAGSDYVIWGSDDNNIIDLKAKDIRLKNGQTQEFVVQSPVDNGKAFVTVLQDDVLLDYFVHDIETFGDRIQVPIKENYYPNFYTKVFIIGQNKETGMPVFARGAENTQVNTDYKKLNVDVSTDRKTYKPGENVTLNLDIKDHEGNPVDGVDGSIAVVDKSVLALLGNPKINPFSYFYDVTRSLAVNGYSSLKNLIEVLDVSDYEDGGKGGGGAQDADSTDRQRGEFRDTAFWIDQFETDENGKVEIQTDSLPDNLTTRSIQVLANHPETNQIGVGTNSFKTSQEVMIDTNLPRFVSSSDQVVFKPVVHNQSGQDSDFEVYMTGSYMSVQNPNKTIHIQDGQSVGVEFVVDVDDMGVLKSDESIASKINIQATSKATGGKDNVVKYLQVYESSSPEQIASIGQTDQRSYDERINTQDIQNNKTVLDINYSPTLISNILDVQKNLKTQDTSSILSQLNALMPYVYSKQMHDLAGRKYSLDEKTIQVWRGAQQGYENIPVSERIHNVLASLVTYKSKYGGLARWPSQTDYDSFYPSLDVNSQIVYSLGQLKSIGETPNTVQFVLVADDVIDFLEDRFYKNQRPNCNTDIYNCKYTYTQRLKVVLAFISYYDGASDTDSNLFDKAYKMWKVLEQPSSVSDKLLYADVMARFLKANKSTYSGEFETVSLISPDEKNILQNRIDKIMENILNNELVYNPRGAYIGTDSLNDRLTSTAKFINILAINGMDKYEDISNITDNLFRWLMESKENNSFGSYRDDILVLETINNYLADSNEIQNTDMSVNVLFNDKKISNHQFDKDNIFETVSLKKPLDGLKPESIFNISKMGSGTVYYDIAMKYYLPASEVKPRNRGFGVSMEYYDYDQYENIKIAQNKEDQKYRNGDISYEQLEYPGSVFKYIDPIESSDIQVGDILVSRYTIINNEKRDDVMMNSYIPAGMELLNPNLETQKGPYRFKENSLWDVNEFRENKLFGYKQMLDVGRHTGYYIMRVTHKGKYFTKPTSVYEQNSQEVFGRNEGKMVEIGG